MSKIVIAIGFVGLTIGAASLWWQQTQLLTLLLILLAIAKQQVAPIKKATIWVVVAGVLGTVTESLIMWLGGQPWMYVQEQVFNFPLWLPFLWGMVGLIVVTLREGVSK